MDATTTLTAAAFIAVLLGLFAVRLPAKPVGAEGEAAGPGGVAAGLRYAFGHGEIRAALLLVALVSLTGASAGVLMPVFAVKVFNSGAESLGLLLGALGAGSLIGALRLARRQGVAGLERRVAGAALVAGVALVLFAAWDTLWHALLVLPVVGFCITTIFASSNAFIQLTVPDRLRGRVMSIFTLALHGTMPLGHLAVGAAAELLGAPATVIACGALLFLAAAAFFTLVHRAPR